MSCSLYYGVEWKDFVWVKKQINKYERRKKNGLQNKLHKYIRTYGESKKNDKNKYVHHTMTIIIDG